jgi:hypothetical protein
VAPSVPGFVGVDPTKRGSGLANKAVEKEIVFVSVHDVLLTLSG